LAELAHHLLGRPRASQDVLERVALLLKPPLARALVPETPRWQRQALVEHVGGVDLAGGEVELDGGDLQQSVAIGAEPRGLGVDHHVSEHLPFPLLCTARGLSTRSMDYCC